ncbi:uncharacterized protein TNCV_5046601 [Trichonephila clavipes]|uniref:Uncharacterized protein n=1 Tax=Trichonephila clavipes TaxID=2585209 RepID=A0A8X6WJL4_TRICX|nr:uncharacterized protein TNCV_5046601 [Trichonephila clavipes]
MSSLSLNQYLNEMEDFLQHGNGEKSAEYLSIQHPHATNSRIYNSNPESSIRRIFEPPWDDLVFYHIKCLLEISKGNYTEAYKHHFVLVQYPSKNFSF